MGHIAFKRLYFFGSFVKGPQKHLALGPDCTVHWLPYPGVVYAHLIEIYYTCH